MTLWQRLTGRKQENPAAALYQSVVATGRQTHWYEEGAVPDTVNGRFDMIASVLALVMLRVEAEEEGAALTARLTECFVEDMDGQLRQIGIGDVVIGKGIGKVMSLLAGRISAFRETLASDDAAFSAALLRNIYRGEDPGPVALSHSATQLRAVRDTLAQRSVRELVEGNL